MTGILGKKLGMTQVFNDNGELVSVTVIEAGPCPVLAVKEKSIQLGFDVVKESRLNKPLQGFFKKINVTPRKFVREVLKDPAKEYKLGDEIKADIFSPGENVDISGISIGKGFQGGMKRWNWHGGPQTHGSMSHRRIGSIGSTTTPGRVWKGHHLPGHMGNCRVTVQNLRVIKVDAQNNLILVKGSVPGHRNSYLVIRKTKKQKQKIDKPKTQVGQKAKK
ncbi:MAG: 50S ribosomal protein L3 [Candidatus Omnitrophica bacterium]|nr:50S ribosomal protein L3 [Candidatus Omnitrophota bacterium]